MSTRINFTEEQINHILYDYTCGHKSINKISDEFGVNWYTIARIIKNSGVKIHGIRDSKLKYKVNQSFFDNLDTENKAYWLGFIAADGCVRSNRKTFTLSLAGKDKGHLEKFLFDLDSNYPIYEHVKQNNGKKYPGARVQITNPVLCNSLINHGILPNKTATLMFPDIPTELWRHFIRGLFDGDGSVSGDNTCPNFSICGTEMLLKRVKEILVPGSHIKLYAKGYGMDTFRTLSIGGRKQLEKIFHYFYDDSNVWLDRKKRVFESLIEKPDPKPFYNRGVEKIKRKCVCINTGEVFPSLIEASKKYSVNPRNISKCCKKILKSAGCLNGTQLTWEFFENYNPNI